MSCLLRCAPIRRRTVNADRSSKFTATTTTERANRDPLIVSSPMC